MKKILFFAVLAVALAGFGMQTAGIAHAQTVTSSQSNNAALEQQLQVAKATLLNLEMQQGMIPQSDNQLGGNAAPSPTVSGLSISQISAFENTLATLVGTLSQLNTSINANPNMNASQIAAIETTLGGMQNTLVAMSSAITNDLTENASPVTVRTVHTPAPVVQNTAPSTPVAMIATTTTPTPASPAVTAIPAAVATNPVQATAQASSIWSFTKDHWPAIVIILLVIVILAILFWPENEAKETVTTMTPQKTVTTTQKTTTTTVASSVSAAVASAPTTTTTGTAVSQTVTTAPADSTKIA